MGSARFSAAMTESLCALNTLSFGSVLLRSATTLVGVFVVLLLTTESLEVLLLTVVLFVVLLLTTDSFVLELTDGLTSVYFELNTFR